MAVIVFLDEILRFFCEDIFNFIASLPTIAAGYLIVVLGFIINLE